MKKKARDCMNEDGSFVPPVMLKPGDEAAIHIEGLGAAHLSVR